MYKPECNINIAGRSRKESYKEYYENNKDIILARHKEYNEKNRVQVLAQNREYTKKWREKKKLKKLQAIQENKYCIYILIFVSIRFEHFHSLNVG